MPAMTTLAIELNEAQRDLVSHIDFTPATRQNKAGVAGDIESKCDFGKTKND